MPKILNNQVMNTIVGLLATGFLLNFAGSGKIGTTAQKAANFITKGFGQ